MNYVFDACALIAFLDKEPEGLKVKALGGRLFCYRACSKVKRGALFNGGPGPCGPYSSNNNQVTTPPSNTYLQLLTSYLLTPKKVSVAPALPYFPATLW